MTEVLIAEDGQECLSDKRDGLQDCFNKSMKNIIPDDFSREDLPLLVIGESECNKFTTLQHCFVKELETCKDKTPANVMEALFKFIRKTLPCSTERQARAAGVGGPQQYASNYVADINQETIIDKIVNETSESIDLLMERLRKKCVKHDDLRLAFSYIGSTLREFFTYTQIMRSVGTTCKVKKYIIQNNLERFIVDLKWCLTDEEDFLPQFLRDAVNSALNYLCEDEDQRLRFFSTSKGLQGFTHTSKNPLRDCFNSLAGNETVDGKIILKKSTACKSLQSADECVTLHCPGDSTLPDLAHGVFQALHAPCSGSSIFLRNTVWLSALILFYFRKLWY